MIICYHMLAQTQRHLLKLLRCLSYTKKMNSIWISYVQRVETSTYLMWFVNLCGDSMPIYLKIVPNLAGYVPSYWYIPTGQIKTKQEMRFFIRQLYDSSIVHQWFTTEKINASGIYNGGDYDQNHGAKKNWHCIPWNLIGWSGSLIMAFYNPKTLSFARNLKININQFSHTKLSWLVERKNKWTQFHEHVLFSLKVFMNL